MREIPRNVMWIEPTPPEKLAEMCPVTSDGAYDIFARERSLGGTVISSAVYVMTFKKDEVSGIRLCFECYIKDEKDVTTHYAEKFVIEEGSSLRLRFYCDCGELKCVVKANGTHISVEGVPPNA